MAKLLVSSLLRTRFSGDIAVFHNSPAPLFMVPRAGVREVLQPIDEKTAGAVDFSRFANLHKYDLGPQIDPAGYDKVMFLDSDVLVLRNIDHLLAGDWDLAIYTEPGTRIQDPPYGAALTSDERQSLVHEGINSGTWAVAASRFHELLASMQKEIRARPPLPWNEQPIFNRVALDWRGSVKRWPAAEIGLPLVNDEARAHHSYMQKSIVHAAGGYNLDDKLRFLFSVFAAQFLFDSRLTLFNILEM